MATERNAVGIKAHFVYWQKGGAGTPYLKVSNPIPSYQRALDAMFTHAKDNPMPTRNVSPDSEYTWEGSHEAIIFLQGRDFEQQQKGGWLLPRKGYQLDNKERSALKYLEGFGLGGIEQR